MDEGVKTIKKINFKNIKMLFAYKFDNYNFEDYNAYREYIRIHPSRRERFSSGVCFWKDEFFFFKKAPNQDSKQNPVKFYLYRLDSFDIKYLQRLHNLYQRYVGFNKDFYPNGLLPRAIDVVMNPDRSFQRVYFDLLQHHTKPTIVKNSQKEGFFYYEYPKTTKANQK